MHKRFYVVGVVALFLVGLAALFPHLSPVPGVPSWAASQWSTIDGYCTACHDRVEKKAGVAFDTADFNRMSDDAERWEKVVRKVRTGMMPPSGEPRPRRGALDDFAAEIEKRLDQAALKNPNPGAPALHRLNRTEYANVIRDLLALEVDVSTLLPADDAAEGFDNIADVLGVSPSLIQGYVSAAMKLSRLAVGDRTMIPTRATYRASAGLAQDKHIEGLPLGTRGGMLVQHTFPLDAEYEFNVTGGFGGGRGGGGPALGGGGFDIPYETVVTLDGKPLEVASTRNFKLPIAAGPHTIGVALVDRRRSAGVDDIFSVYSVAGSVQGVVIIGPNKPTGTGETPSRRRIFVCQPKTAAEETSCAAKILETVATRAFRRPVRSSDAELRTVLGFYERARRDGDFENGIQQALARILVDPRFLFRIEKDPAELSDGAVYRLSDIELASRLSFFLWSSIPDDELLDLASNGQLSDENVLEKQVLRMLADPRADALVKNFAGQWLHLRELASAQPDTDEFDANLRESFERETEMLFASIIREDRSIVDLLDADYTFVDERLARHYGMPDVRGSYMRRVNLDADSPRRGLLGQGSILTVTSVADRTSPVSRGKWILENILGVDAPAPPPGVETDLAKVAVPQNVHTLRQRLELHRADPTCASCHKIMDPIGFSLENFDRIGKWRESDSGAPVDASGVLVDGTSLNGPNSLRRALLSRSDEFVTTVTEKLLTYALGRGVRYYDMPTVRTIVRDAKDRNYRFSSLAVGIAKSVPFQKKIKTAASDATPNTEATIAQQAAPVAARQL